MRFLWSIVFIIAGLFLIFYPQLEKQVSDAKEKELVETFENLGEMTDLDETSVSTVPKEKLEGIKGVIRIPKIDLEMPILEGATKSSLSKGVGIIQSDKEIGKNNVGLAGHRGATRGKQFNRLDELEPKDEIEVKTKSGTFQFLIVDKFVVDRSDVEVLNDQKEPFITLVTCTPIGAVNPTDRLIVQARLKHKG
ncbi:MULTISPECIES: class D sortase [Bacillus]|uniref:class D sortase n=1 Tax=Bacillus TaxID=1386 RepID=UPI0003137DF3|nr:MULTISPECIES: class D sortase [Bacillus]